MDICIDFDGTCVTHEFPKVGKDIGAAPVLKRLVEAGHQLILFTMRSDQDEVAKKPSSPEILGESGCFLTDAIEWFKKNNIPLYGIQTNPTQKEWTDSPKAYGQLYVDDAALGIPLTEDSEVSDRPYVHWQMVENLLEAQDILGMTAPF